MLSHVFLSHFLFRSPSLLVLFQKNGKEKKRKTPHPSDISQFQWRRGRGKEEKRIQRNFLYRMCQKSLHNRYLDQLCYYYFISGISTAAFPSLTMVVPLTLFLFNLSSFLERLQEKDALNQLFTYVT